MQTAELLLEIGSEEIPDWMIEPALADWKRRFLAALEGFNLTPEGEPVLAATPRRLVLMVEKMPVRQEDRDETITGPPARSLSTTRGIRPRRRSVSRSAPGLRSRI